ncbi:MAG: hypothetical protein ABH880_01525 [Patescibacteria group bacterium]
MKYIDNSRSKTLLIGVYAVLWILILLGWESGYLYGIMLGIPIGIWLGYRAKGDKENL